MIDRNRENLELRDYRINQNTADNQNTAYESVSPRYERSACVIERVGGLGGCVFTLLLGALVYSALSRKRGL